MRSLAPRAPRQTRRRRGYPPGCTGQQAALPGGPAQLLAPGGATRGDPGTAGPQALPASGRCAGRPRR
eukprot:9171877-Lingulodinium_polyedra.AAC.1